MAATVRGTNDSGMISLMCHNATQITDILRHARVTLSTATQGFDDFQGIEPKRRLAGLRNAIVFGRAVSNVVENLRSQVHNFDDWYKPRSAAFAADARFKRLYQIRSEILKQGRLDAGSFTHIKQFGEEEMRRLMQNAPANAHGFFVGDATSGSGWEVNTASGQTEIFYVEIPDYIPISVGHSIRVNDEDVNAKDLLSEYLAAMKELIDDAEKTFSPKPRQLP